MLVIGLDSRCQSHDLPRDLDRRARRDDWTARARAEREERERDSADLPIVGVVDGLGHVPSERRAAPIVGDVGHVNTLIVKRVTVMGHLRERSEDDGGQRLRHNRHDCHDRIASKPIRDRVPHCFPLSRPCGDRVVTVVTG